MAGLKKVSIGEAYIRLKKGETKKEISDSLGLNPTEHKTLWAHPSLKGVRKGDKVAIDLVDDLNEDVVEACSKFEFHKAEQLCKVNTLSDTEEDQTPDSKTTKKEEENIYVRQIDSKTEKEEEEEVDIVGKFKKAEENKATTGEFPFDETEEEEEDETEETVEEEAEEEDQTEEATGESESTTEESTEIDW